MKIKTLVAVLLLSGGVTSTFAQTENCNSVSYTHLDVYKRQIPDSLWYIRK